MLFTLAFLAAATITSPRPELVSPEPVTRSARLLQALSQAEDDFASVKRELGLVGAAPLTGLKADEPPVRPETSSFGKPRARKASAKTRN